MTSDEIVHEAEKRIADLERELVTLRALVAAAKGQPAVVVAPPCPLPHWPPPGAPWPPWPPGVTPTAPPVFVPLQPGLPSPDTGPLSPEWRTTCWTETCGGVRPDDDGTLYGPGPSIPHPETLYKSSPLHDGHPGRVPGVIIGAGP